MLERIKDVGRTHSRLLIAVSVLLVVALGAFGSSTMKSSGPSSAHYPAAEADGSPGYDLDRTEVATGHETNYDSKSERLDMEYEVRDAKRSLERTKEIVGDFDGNIEDERYRNREREDYSTVTVKVPRENVSDFLDTLETEDWELSSRSSYVEDIGDRQTELELELENRRQEMQRLRELMNSTNSTDSLIRIQERMTELQTRIQHLENQKQELDEKTNMTMIDLRFEEPAPFTADFELSDTLKDSYRAVFQSLRWMVVGAGYLAPFALLYGIYRFLRRKEIF